MDNEYYDEGLHVDIRDLREVRKVGTAIDILINAIKSTDNYDDHLSAVSSFYDFAYRRGYDDGLKEVRNDADSN